MQLVEGEATVEDVTGFVDRLAALEEEYGATIQAFDARYVAGRAHLERAVALARRARERSAMIAREFGVEILLYAAGRRQINRALEMGVSEGECPVVAVVVGGDEEGAASALEELLTVTETLGRDDPERVREFFDVSEQELAATDGTLEDLVCERVALLVVEQ